MSTLVSALRDVIPASILDYLGRAPASEKPLRNRLETQARQQAMFAGLPHKNYEGHAYARLALDLAEAHDALAWHPIETLGFGVDEPVIVATDGGFAWVVDCDKDMDGAWIKGCSERREDVEHIGVVTHWRFLGALPQQAGIQKAEG